MDEIEELRAKAIAAIPSSANPNSSTAAASAGGNKFKSPISREEGELSSSEDAELNSCSSAPPKSTNMGEPTSHTLRNNTLQNIKAAKNAAASHLSYAGMQLRPSAMQNYHKRLPKHFKRRQTTFRSISNQALHWHAKESKNNLVISFSDDDSESESEGCNAEKDVNKMDFTSIADISRITMASLPKHAEQYLSMKDSVNHATIASVRSGYETNSGPQDTSTENGYLIQRQIPAIKASISQELENVQGSAMADQRLESLRHQIATRENLMKVQNKLVLQKGASVDSDSNQHDPHAMELEAMTTGIRKHAHDSITEFEANEQSKKRLKLDKYSPSFDFNMPSKPENHKTFLENNSFSHCPHEKNNIVKCTDIENRNSYLVTLAANLHDGAFSENNAIEGNMRSQKFSRKSKVSNPPSSNVGAMHVIVRNHQTSSKTDVGMPLETFFIHEKSSKCGSGTKEASIEGVQSMPFNSLAKLEELHEKELEDAQEHRRKCELEERHTLKAYRKAQRALIEANERCSYLYRKCELFSAKFRTFVTEASSSMCPSNWPSQQIPQDQFLEPDARTSIHRNNSVLDGAVPHAHIPNEFKYDDEEDFPSTNRLIESRSADVDVEIENAPSVDNSQDYELLEASLRSELVARLGVRSSSKVNDTCKRELIFEKRAPDAAEDTEPSPLIDGMVPSLEKKQPLSLEGVERPIESSCLLTAPSDAQSHANVFPSNEELQSVIHVDNNNSFPKDSGNTTCTAGFPLPSSDLHILCRHIYLASPGFHTEAFRMKKNDYLMTSKENCTPNIIGEILGFTRNTTAGFKGLDGSSVEVDPLWPLCMFEFRGKCNDEECPWQHRMKDVQGSCLTNGKSDDVPRFSCSVLPIPTYQIGPYLIKADSHPSQSVLARSSWKYHQRGFCASFSLPFSVQRILPSDAPCLQPSDNPVADDYSWNRLSSYYQNHDSTLASKEQIKQGSGDVEQLLEMALDQFDGEFCESDRKKALSVLARAIEAYPSSVVLWIVYLHIYYIKEKAIGKDDMFLHAVQHNKGSYELWLLYINSRLLCDDRLNAYDRALNVLCHIGVHDRTKDFSTCILDIFLQMIDFLCMSGQVEKAFGRIYGLLPDTDFDKFSDDSLPDIRTCLTVPDICLFWVLCVYFMVYEKLPDTTVQQFEFVKNLPFGLNWPYAQLELDRKELALENMKLAMTHMDSQLDDRSKGTDQASLRSLHFLAVSHVKCVAALQGSPASTELLAKYLKLYPSCMELVLMAIRSSENCTTDVEISSFEVALHSWPNETPGIQCLWSQYMEYALANCRIDLSGKLMDNWYQDFSKRRDFSSILSLVHSKTKDDAYGILNLSLYLMRQNNVVDACIAIDKSLELAAPQDFIHFVKEHAAFIILNEHEPWKHFPLGNLHGLLIRYLADHRSSLDLLPLTRWFIRTIKKPRIQQKVHDILGPVSAGFILMNSVLEVCYGPSFLPEKFNDIKDVVNVVEMLMEMMPANYELALSVYRVFSSYFIPTHPDWSTLKFWACTLLINSIFLAAPVAPEYTWLEAANLLNNSESMEISLRFHKQAISVYPFSVNLWRSYANLHNTTDRVSEIIEAAQERGIDLNDVIN